MTITALGAPLAPAATGVQPAVQAPGADDAGAFARRLELAAQPEATADRAPAPAQRSAQEAARAKARAAGERPAAERAARPAADGERAAAPAADAGTPETPADAAPPADLAALLAGLLAHALPQQREAARAEDAPATDEAGATEATGGRRERKPPGLVFDAAGGDQAQQLRARADAEATLPPVRPDAAAFALPQAQPAPAAAAAAAAPVYTAQVDAALGTPEFAPGLSAQVTVMLREGVQEARLQLNPAEMGPITVQIQIDGSSARVDLAAEQAPTRQALEEALPTLAGALQENGLTLTGGGVFEQPRRPRDDDLAGDGEAPRRFGVDGPAAADGGAPTTLAPRRPVARGVVDLYA